MDGSTLSSCPNCGEAAPQEATWCEACGHELGTVVRPACVSCGEREVDAAEGYCLSCGYRQPRERDHVVMADGPVVAASDRGRRHHDNEDSVAVGWVSGSDDAGVEAVVLVVCDGVSSTPGSALASAAASVAARDVLVGGLSQSEDPGEHGDPESDGAEPGSDGIVRLLAEAVAAAQSDAAASAAGVEIEPVPHDRGDGPPSSTLVAVVARPQPHGVELVTAWVGDSRAYWIGPDTARRLTVEDHEYEGGLVRWLGADSLDPTPDMDVVTATGQGHLVVCSDGLWRYASDPEELAALVRRLSDEGRSGTDLAEALVEHANQQGGHDNISVAVWSNRPDWPLDLSDPEPNTSVLTIQTVPTDIPSPTDFPSPTER